MNPTPSTNDDTKQNELSVEDFVDRYLPQPYPNYNMGLLPDEDGYDEVQIVRNSNWYIEKQEATGMLKSMIISEGRKMAEYAIKETDKDDGELRKRVGLETEAVFLHALALGNGKDHEESAEAIMKLIDSHIGMLNNNSRTRLDEYIKDNYGE